MAKRKRRLKKLPIFILLVLLLAGGYFAYTKLFSGNDNSSLEKVSKPKEKVDIVDVDGTVRNVAVMINNHPSARPYHSGLNDAHIIYEILVEGGYTRYMALYNNKDTEKIGSVRSSRHYFLDYAMENDALYVHYGWSPQAESDIRTYKVNNKPYEMEAAPYLQGEGYTMVPVRYVAKAFGVEEKNIVLSGDNVILFAGSRMIILGYNTNKIQINGVEMEIEAPTEMKAGRLYLPAGALARILGVSCKWDDATKTATFTS